MFDVLVYLYENYHRPDVCPEPAELAKSLSDVGFKETEIKDALAWLTDLAAKSEEFVVQLPDDGTFPVGKHRIYADQEYAMLGSKAIGHIDSLESSGVLMPVQREIVIERALAVKDTSLTLEKLRIIVLMLMWSQGDDPDMLKLDTLFPDDDDDNAHLPH